MPKKILIVDDEPDLLEVAAFRLKKSGYEVLSAADGRQALDIVKNDKPDLVLLDLRLPVIDGYDVCRRIKADDRFKNIHVILFTASAAGPASDKIGQTGADDCIIKPFESEELLKKVKKLIG